MKKRWLCVLLCLWLCAVPARGQDYFDPDHAYQEALRRIEEAKVSGHIALNLSQMDLTAVPPEIGQLKHLERLNLFDNRLTSLPPELFQLISLRMLSVAGNQLTLIPPQINQLINLEHLELGGNSLTTLPSEVGQLINLRYLSVSSNHLTNLPPEIGQLIKLEGLDISNNNSMSLPLEIGRLSGVTVYISPQDTVPLAFPPPEIASQGASVLLAYLRDYHAMIIRQTIAAIVAGVSGIFLLMLTFRYRQQRSLNEKKKRL